MPDREKVIKGLERCKLYNKVNCDKCPYDYNGRGDGKSECTAELASDAIALLKEQEPIKPTINEYGEAYCVCGENVGIIPNSKDLPKIRSKYCSECGRRMKWE